MTDSRLDAIDILTERLSSALSDKDWDEIAQLSQSIKPTIEPVMAALEAGELEPEPVRERLASLQTFCDSANISAKDAREEAKRALEEINQNRSAAKAYQSVSFNPGRD